MANKKITLKVKKDNIVSVGSVEFVDFKTECLHVNKNHKKNTHDKDELIVEMKQSRLVYAYGGKGKIRNTYEFTVEEIEAFAKACRKRKTMFEKQDKARLAKGNKSLINCFFMHFTPDLSILFTETPKKKKKS